VNSSSGGKLSGCSPSGSAPIPPTSHYRSKSQLRNRSGGLYSKNQGADCAPHKANTTTEQREGTTPIKPPFKGIIPQGSGQISPTRGTDTRSNRNYDHRACGKETTTQ